MHSFSWLYCIFLFYSLFSQIFASPTSKLPFPITFVKPLTSVSSFGVVGKKKIHIPFLEKLGIPSPQLLLGYYNPPHIKVGGTWSIPVGIDKLLPQSINRTCDICQCKVGVNLICKAALDNTKFLLGNWISISSKKKVTEKSLYEASCFLKSLNTSINSLNELNYYQDVDRSLEVIVVDSLRRHLESVTYKRGFYVGLGHFSLINEVGFDLE